MLVFFKLQSEVLPVYFAVDLVVMLRILTSFSMLNYLMSSQKLRFEKSLTKVVIQFSNFFLLTGIDLHVGKVLFMYFDESLSD